MSRARRKILPVRRFLKKSGAKNFWTLRVACVTPWGALGPAL
jgi:hypothetical protein